MPSIVAKNKGQTLKTRQCQVLVWWGLFILGLFVFLPSKRTSCWKIFSAVCATLPLPFFLTVSCPSLKLATQATWSLNKTQFLLKTELFFSFVRSFSITCTSKLIVYFHHIPPMNWFQKQSITRKYILLKCSFNAPLEDHSNFGF